MADPTNNRLVHFDSIDQLPLDPTPYAPDTAVPAVSPRSAFLYDQYGDLLVARRALIASSISFPRSRRRMRRIYLTTDVHALAPGTFTVILSDRQHQRDFFGNGYQHYPALVHHVIRHGGDRGW